MPETSNSKFVLYYDSCREFGFELGDILKQELAPSVNVEEIRVLGGASPIIPILEMFFISSTTPIVTSMLSKLGEDLYKHLKGKLTKGVEEKEQPQHIRITIITEDIATKGSTTVSDFKSAFDAITNAQQMIATAEKYQQHNNKGVVEETTQHIRHGLNHTSVVKSGIAFGYEYDGKNSKWILKSIGKIENV